MPTDTDRELGERIDVLSKQFNDLRVELVSGFGEIKVQLATQTGALTANLEAFKSQTSTSFRVAVTAVCLAIPAILGAFASWNSAGIQTARMDERLKQLERGAK